MLAVTVLLPDKPASLHLSSMMVAPQEEGWGWEIGENCISGKDEIFTDEYTQARTYPMLCGKLP